MRILIVSQHFYPENFRINDFAQELVKQGHQVSVLTGLPNYPKGKLYPGFGFFSGPYRENWQGIDIVRTPIITRGSNKGLRLVLNYLTFAIIGSVIALCRLRGQFDRVFVHQTSPVFMGIPAVVHKIFFGSPVYFWILDLWPETLVSLKIVKHNSFVVKALNRIVSWIYAHCEKILVPSNKIRYQLRKLGIADEKIIYFPYWAEDIFLQRDFPEQQQSVVRKLMPQGFNVTFSGNIGVAQGFDTIVEAARLLREHTDISFIILGDGHVRSEVEEKVARLNLQRSFQFLGTFPMEYMPVFYKYSHALLVSLIKDPLFEMTIPSKIQAYMAAGKPIIAALQGEGAEIITAAGCGLVASPDDAHALANAILHLKSLDESERRKMGERGHRYYMQKFHREKVLDRFATMGA